MESSEPQELGLLSSLSPSLVSHQNPPPSDTDAEVVDLLHHLDLKETDEKHKLGSEKQNLVLKETRDTQNLHLEEESCDVKEATHEAQNQSFDVKEVTHETQNQSFDVKESTHEAQHLDPDDFEETHHTGLQSGENEEAVKNSNGNEVGGSDCNVVKNEESVKGHPYPLRPDAEDCTYYIKTGTCKFGSNCKFNHPLRRKSSQVPMEKVVEMGEELAERPGLTECKYYLRTGGCKFGKTCRYNHPRGKFSVAPVLELNFLGLPIRLGEKECPYYMRTGSCKYGANCRFNHPDPTSSGGSEPSGRGTGKSVSIKGAPPSAITSWTSPKTLEETSPFLPMMFQPTQRIPSQTPEWNGYQASPYPLPERSIPPAYVMSPATETNVYTYQQQQMLLDDYPERPGQPECSYYLKTGDCKFKSNCKYHHPKTQITRSPPCPLSDMGLPLRPDQNICSHYSRYGICKFGPACKFDHPVHYHASAMTGFDQPPRMGGSRSEAAIQQHV